MAKKERFGAPNLGPSGRPAVGSPADYDRTIDYHLKHKGPGWEKEVHRLMGHRNYNARLYSLPERPLPRALRVGEWASLGEFVPANETAPYRSSKAKPKKAKAQGLKIIGGRAVKA